MKIRSVMSILMPLVLTPNLAKAQDLSASTCEKKEVDLETCYVLPSVDLTAMLRVEVEDGFDEIHYSYGYMQRVTKLLMTTYIVRDPLNATPPQVVVKETRFKTTENLIANFSIHTRQGNEHTLAARAETFIASMRSFTCKDGP